ncbi:uncharacterized protein PAC_07936 [Phialocephala subalpina]|uniref:2EXR domain-containing protein n=1 Tax=Phialocephala subalpina TaxID=576137 RepID=A0A1L7WZ38_9HELO|nr:uncharacterized protein PAC_07936 [Phialocephala subalpina]
MASNDDTKQPTFDKFTFFPKLPIELRLAIWALAAPEPAIIKQRISSVKGRRFHFARTVPVVLHACRESRNQYLNENGNDETLERCCQAYPVYKMHSAPGGVLAPTCQPTLTLSHLILTYDVHCVVGVRDFRMFKKYFSCMKKLTFVVPEADLKLDDRNRVIVYKPEIDGEMDDSDMRDPVTRPWIFTWRDGLDEIPLMLEAAKPVYPDETFPVVKIRFEKQFVEVENVEWPAASTST